MFKETSKIDGTSFYSGIVTKTIVKRSTEKLFKTVEKKTLIKTCFNKHDKISFNIY